MSDGSGQRRQRRDDRRHIRCFLRTIRRRRDRVPIEENLVRVVHAIDERRILERRRIRVRIDQTAPPERTEVRRILKRIGVDSQTEIKVGRIRSHEEHRIGCIADDVARSRRIAFDVANRRTAQTGSDPTRVWWDKRKRGGSCIDVSHRRHPGQYAGCRQ